ncbi:l(3)87Df family protein [Megaselia abdita]
MTDDESHKSLHIFGTDVSMIPCFRSSFLYGISGGIVGGLLTFLRTSRPLLSCHYGMGTFTVTTLGYWSWCRYNWSKKSIQYQQLQSALQKQAAFEGTALEDEMNAKAGLKSA